MILGVLIISHPPSWLSGARNSQTIASEGSSHCILDSDSLWERLHMPYFEFIFKEKTSLNARQEAQTRMGRHKEMLRRICPQWDTYRKKSVFSVLRNTWYTGKCHQDLWSSHDTKLRCNGGRNNDWPRDKLACPLWWLSQWKAREYKNVVCIRCTREGQGTFVSPQNRKEAVA